MKNLKKVLVLIALLIVAFLAGAAMLSVFLAEGIRDAF